MKYTSKQVQIARTDETIFAVLSSFDNFTPIIADKVEGWEASGDRCRFKAKGFNIALKMVEREANKLIKVTTDDSAGGVPIPFTLWVQLIGAELECGVAVADTRLRIVLEVELNPMMKMVVGGKMQTAVDTIADQIAHAFNNTQV